MKFNSLGIPKVKLAASGPRPLDLWAARQSPRVTKRIATKLKKWHLGFTSHLWPIKTYKTAAPRKWLVANLCFFCEKVFFCLFKFNDPKTFHLFRKVHMLFTFESPAGIPVVSPSKCSAVTPERSQDCGVAVWGMHSSGMDLRWPMYVCSMRFVATENNYIFSCDS